MEFSFDKQHESDTSNIANERLRKAIERNRQRQKEREAKEQEIKQTQSARPEAQSKIFTPPPPPPPFEEQINQAAAKENLKETIIEEPFIKN